MASLTENALGGVRTTLWVLLGAVGFVLLIVCANVANLFLARAAGRQKEIAIRSALGASRSRLVRQFLTESTILAVTGGAIGILVAAWGVRLLAASPALGMPRSNEIAVNGAVLIFSLCISFLAGILFGIVPAWRTSRINLSEIMNEASRGSSAGARRNRAGALIIIAELGFSVVLLAGAGPSTAKFLSFAPRAFGIRAAKCSDLSNRFALHKISAAISENRISRTASRTHRHNSRRSFGGHCEPGSTAQRFVRALSRGRNATGSAARPAANRSVEFHQSGLFQTLGIPMLKGRNFSDADIEKSNPVVIISQSLAARHWSHVDPIGQHIQIARQPTPAEIVGVVSDSAIAALAPTWATNSILRCRKAVGDHVRARENFRRSHADCSRCPQRASGG